MAPELKDSQAQAPYSREAYIHPAILSQGLVEALVSGNINDHVVLAVEKELNAYFDSSKLGGTVMHPPGLGPELPYFRPCPTDLVPEIQAISRIGVQADYWRLVLQAIKNKKIPPANYSNMNMLVLYPQADGSTSVDIQTYPNFLIEAARVKGDSIPNYPGYLSLINYGRDTDFKVFHSYYQKTFNNWLNNDAPNDCEVPPDWISILKKDNSIDCQSYVVRAILRKLPVKDWGKMERILKILADKFAELLDQEGENNSLVQVLKTHADNLTALYETAKAFRSDIYHY